MAARLVTQAHTGGGTADGAMSGGRTPGPGWDADEAVTRLFGAHYRPLVRLAALLVADRAVAEELVQDAYVRLHQRWRRLREPDQALAYLRTSVLNG
ncbi:MAG TPA: sigma factor, partial [Rugosimonospora sp.]|nr:sigma factor [Rugosimonospora sp.]